MLLGQKLGLDPAVLASVVGSSTGSCWSMTANNPVPNALPEKSPPCERDYEGGFATSLMLKVHGCLPINHSCFPTLTITQKRTWALPQRLQVPSGQHCH